MTNLDAELLHRIRRFFDDAMYALVDYRLSLETPVGPTGFPPFPRLQQAVERLDPDLRTVFRLFRLGEEVDGAAVERAVPSAVLDSCSAAGLLSAGDGTWRTPSLLVVPVHGLLVVVSVPPSYPTASRAPRVWFDLSSYITAESLPGSLAGRRVLEVCTGSGVQALLCAGRGAASVTALELDEEAVAVARLNAELNGVQPPPDFRRSDRLAALADDERFDFVLCNTPYAPVLADEEGSATPDAIGNSVLFGVLERLPRHLSQDACGIVAAWRCVGDGDSTWQTERITAQLAEHGFSCVAFLDRAPDDVDNVMRILSADAEERWGAAGAEPRIAAARQALRDAGAAERGFFNQLIFFQRGAPVRTRLHRLRQPGGGGKGP